MRRVSSDGKWEIKKVAYLEGPPQASVLPERFPESGHTFVDDLEPKVLGLLVWRFEQRKPNLFPSDEDILNGMYFFESQENRKPDRLILPKVAGSKLFGVEIELQ